MKLTSSIVAEFAKTLKKYIKTCGGTDLVVVFAKSANYRKIILMKLDCPFINISDAPCGFLKTMKCTRFKV